jgi:hypothetical protein
MSKRKFLTSLILISVYACLILAAVNLSQKSLYPAQVSADSGGVFGPACGQAFIDGSIGEPGWASAASQTFGLSNPSSTTPTLTATLRIMNDMQFLYLGISVNDDEFTPMGDFLPQGDAFLFYFDNDHSGVLFEPDDDVLSANAGSPQFLDKYIVGMPVPTSNQPDTEGGGTTDGAAAAGRIGNLNHFEMKHDLCSGDSLDFCLQPGDIVGFQLTYLDAESNGSFGGVHFFPGSSDTDTADIVIGDCTIPDLIVFLPVVLR